MKISLTTLPGPLQQPNTAALQFIELGLIWSRPYSPPPAAPHTWQWRGKLMLMMQQNSRKQSTICSAKSNFSMHPSAYRRFFNDSLEPKTSWIYSNKSSKCFVCDEGVWGTSNGAWDHCVVKTSTMHPSLPQLVLLNCLDNWYSLQIKWQFRFKMYAHD